MKHLICYKIFENIESNLEDIKDILIELNDSGIYEIDVSKPNVGTVNNYDKIQPISFLNSIQISISKKDNTKFRIGDISDELLRIKDYISDSYKILIKFEERKWLSNRVFIEDLSKIEYKEAHKIYVDIYNTTNTYHVIWISKDDPKMWNVLKPDFKTREEAIKYIEGTHISRADIVKSFISDEEYWLKIKYLS
jgi:hypothetical protein